MIVHIIEGRKVSEFEECTKILVDVFRSTTTMPVILEKGALKIIPTSTVKDARALRKANTEYVLVGERYGLRIPGFDLNNSPSDVLKADLSGKTVVFTSTNGTKVLKKIAATGKVFIASFVNAEATRSALADEDRVDIVVSGRPDGKADEDLIFADYMKELLLGNSPDFQAYAAKIRSSNGAARLRMMGYRVDIEASLQLDSMKSAVIFSDGRIVRS